LLLLSLNYFAGLLLNVIVLRGHNIEAGNDASERSTRIVTIPLLLANAAFVLVMVLFLVRKAPRRLRIVCPRANVARCCARLRSFKCCVCCTVGSFSTSSLFALQQEELALATAGDDDDDELADGVALRDDDADDALVAQFLQQQQQQQLQLHLQ
jgi:hypothetical protein